MARMVTGVTDTAGGTVVTFECPICGEEESDVMQSDDPRPTHACRTTQTIYPLLPTVSLTGQALDELSSEESVEMQLRSVEASRPFVERYGATSQEVLFALTGAFTSLITGTVGIVNVLFMSVVFAPLLESSQLIFAVFLFDLLLLALGLVAVWGLTRNIKTALDYVEVNDVPLSKWQFVAAIGNYYGENPFRQWFLELDFLYPNEELPEK